MGLKSRAIQEVLEQARRFPSRIRKHGPDDLPPGFQLRKYAKKQGKPGGPIDKDLNGQFPPVAPASGPNPFKMSVHTKGQRGIRAEDYNRARKTKQGAGDFWTGPIGSFPKTYGLNLALGGGAVLGGSAIYKELKRRGWIE